MMFRSTFARVALLIAAVLVVIVLCSLFLFGRFGFEERMRSRAENFAETATELVQVLEQQGPSAARELLRGRSRHRIRLERGPPPGPGRPPPRFMVPALGEFTEELGPGTELRLHGRAPSELWVFSPRLQGYAIVFQLRPDHTHPPVALIGWIALAATVVFAGAYIFTRYLTRPLVRLADATQYIARGEALPDLPETGPTEVRRLVSALRHASEEARRTARDREMMLAGISHDLRTPLARLRIAAEMLPTRASELCNGMVQDIEELDAIIGQFLSYVRDGSDEVALWVRLDDVIRSAVEPLRRESDCIELHLAEMPPMHLRPLAIQRLITNLVTNATTHGKPPVRVDCGFRGGTPFLAVRDHGSGIDPDRFDELLRPFSRGDHARSTQGSGLGLAIVARIARVHRAEVLPERRADGFAVRVHFPASIGENLG